MLAEVSEHGRRACLLRANDGEARQAHGRRQGPVEEGFAEVRRRRARRRDDDRLHARVVSEVPGSTVKSRSTDWPTPLCHNTLKTEQSRADL